MPWVLFDRRVGAVSLPKSSNSTHLGIGTIWSDSALDSDARRKGYWALNAALALIAGTVIAFFLLTAG